MQAGGTQAARGEGLQLRLQHVDAIAVLVGADRTRRGGMNPQASTMDAQTGVSGPHTV